MSQTPKLQSENGKAPLPNLRSGGFVGDACSATTPCREGLHCAGLFSDGKGAYPQGMCTTTCPKGSCPEDPSYPAARCVQWPNETEPICMVGCNERGSCDRVGYECGRADRADGVNGFRYLCTPRPGSSRNALEAARQNGVVAPPPGTRTLSEIARLVRGGPAEFSPNARYSLNANAANVALVVEETPPAEDATDAPVVDEAPAAPTGPVPVAEVLVPPAPRRDETAGLSVVSWAIIGAVALITLFSVIRLMTSSRVGGVLRDIRSSTDDETPLERIRREDRERRRTSSSKDAPEVRVARRLPTRPLRDDRLTMAPPTNPLPPVMSREEAEARKIVAPLEPAPADVVEVSPSSETGFSSVVPSGAAPSSGAAPLRVEIVASDAQVDGAHEAPYTSEVLPPLQNRSTLRSSGFDASSRVGGGDRDAVRSEPVEPARPSDWMNPPDPNNPLMDVGRPFVARLWGGARAAKPYGVRKFQRTDEHLPTLIEMDEFVSPLPLEVVLQLLDELLVYAGDLRQKKGYDAVVYIETDPRRTWFRRGPEGKIRLHHAPDAFAKPVLASDIMRRKGFSPSMRPQDAHVLSLTHLGRFLLGSAAWDDVLLTMDDLSHASRRFSPEEHELLEYLLAPAENEHLKRLSQSRTKTSSVRVEVPDEGVGPRETPAYRPADDRLLPCPNCASQIEVGDLACRHCGTALHPRPVYCSSCGTRNLVFADGREQLCLNFECSEPIVHSALQADVEGRRLSIISDLLSNFEEFRKLPSRGGNERYEAIQGGRRVEIWQVQSDRGTIIVEDMRPQYMLDERVTLPSRQSERSGLSFIVYDPAGVVRHPLYSLGAEGLAEQLLSLMEMVHEAKLRLPGLSTEDLSVSERGEVCLLTGHRLRVATQPTPRLLETRFVAPELSRQALATERSDLYTIAAIWYFTIVGAMPGEGAASNDALLHVPELVREVMMRALSEEPSDRPESARTMLAKLRRRRRISDLV